MHMCTGVHGGWKKSQDPPVYASPVLGSQMHTPISRWVLGIRTQVLVLAWQTLTIEQSLSHYLETALLWEKEGFCLFVFYWNVKTLSKEIVSCWPHKYNPMGCMDYEIIGKKPHLTQIPLSLHPAYLFCSGNKHPPLDELLLAFLDCRLCGLVVQRCRVLILCSITAAGGGREGTLVCKLDAGHSTCHIGSALQWVLRAGFLIPEMSNLRLGEVKWQPLWIT